MFRRRSDACCAAAAPRKRFCCGGRSRHRRAAQNGQKSEDGQEGKDGGSSGAMTRRVLRGLRWRRWRSSSAAAGRTVSRRVASRAEERGITVAPPIGRSAAAQSLHSIQRTDDGRPAPTGSDIARTRRSASDAFAPCESSLHAVSELRSEQTLWTSGRVGKCDGVVREIEVQT